MSLDPGMAAGRASASARVLASDTAVSWPADLPRVTRVEVLSLAEGDRVIVHVDGGAGMSSGGAESAGRRGPGADGAG